VIQPATNVPAIVTAVSVATQKSKTPTPRDHDLRRPFTASITHDNRLRRSVDGGISHANIRTTIPAISVAAITRSNSVGSPPSPSHDDARHLVFLGQFRRVY
jgi:hypothetical protein